MMEEADGKGLVFGRDTEPRKVSAKQRRAAGAHGDINPRKKRVPEIAGSKPIWGEAEPRRVGHSRLRDQVRETVIPAGLVPENKEPKRQKAPLKPGDPFRVFPSLIDFDGPYGTEGVGERSVIDFIEDTTIVAIHRPGRGMTLELKRNNPDAPLSHLYVTKIGKNWIRAKKQ